MFQEILILCVSMGLIAFLSAFILAYPFKKTSQTIAKVPITFKASFLYIFLQDFFGHLAPLSVVLISGGYRPMVTHSPMNWLQNFIGLFIVGFCLWYAMRSVNSLSVSMPKKTGISLLTSIALLARDCLVLFVLLGLNPTP